jgi:hypothetical protein
MDEHLINNQTLYYAGERILILSKLKNRAIITPSTENNNPVGNLITDKLHLKLNYTRSSIPSK